MSRVPGSASTHSSPSSSSHMRRARLRSVVTKVPLTSWVGMMCEAVAGAVSRATVMADHSARLRMSRKSGNRFSEQDMRHSIRLERVSLQLLIGPKSASRRCLFDHKLAENAITRFVEVNPINRAVDDARLGRSPQCGAGIQKDCPVAERSLPCEVADEVTPLRDLGNGCI